MNRRVALINLNILYDTAALNYSTNVFDGLTGGENSTIQEMVDKFGSSLKPNIDTVAWERVWRKSGGEIYLFVDKKDEKFMKYIREEHKRLTFALSQGLEQLDVEKSIFDSSAFVINRKPKEGEDLVNPEGMDGAVHILIDPSLTENDLKALEFKTIADPQLCEYFGLELEIKPCYFVDVEKGGENQEELALWENVVHFACPINFGKATIVSGKQVGRTIGIPTANLNYPSDNLVENKLIPGVYYGVCGFCEDLTLSGVKTFKANVQIPMVASFGTNPHYNDKGIIYEVLILDDFGKQEFYGKEMWILVQGFVRAEAKFDTFDMFIRGMECDVNVGKRMIQLKPSL